MQLPSMQKLPLHLIPFTPALRPSLPPTPASQDYSDWRQQLERIDILIHQLDRALTEDALAVWLKGQPETAVRQQQKFEECTARA